MFIFSLLIGLYSYIIFTLGLVHILYPQVIVIVTSIFVVIMMYVFKKQIIGTFTFRNQNFSSLKQDKIVLTLCILLGCQALVNGIGALGPELAFDALWYHLTLSKLYLLNHAVYHIPGGLLYYSDMPKLAEMMYTGVLSIGTEIHVKVLHYIFGLLCCIPLYLLGKKLTNSRTALLAVVIFYTNLIIGWLSLTAYNDLIRTFFEISAVYYFFEWLDTKQRRLLIQIGILIGLAITTKLLAVGTVFIFVVLLITIFYRTKKSILSLLSNQAVIVIASLLIPLPWLIFAYVHTGNPLYPLFSPLFGSINAKVIDASLLNPMHILSTFWNVFTRANDPISPVYIIFLPVIILYFKKATFHIRLLYVYAALSLILWYITSQVEGSRMLVPYLPVLSLICAASMDYLLQHKKKYGSIMPLLLVTVIIITASISIVYRFAANMKYIPVVFGMESKNKFLENNLNFTFGDFYDTDAYFRNHITENDTVLLYGFHNLYYIDFPYVDSSWVKPGDTFTFIAVQNTELPKRFAAWQRVYINDKTLVKLYKPPIGVCPKVCVY